MKGIVDDSGREILPVEILYISSSRPAAKNRIAVWLVTAARAE